MLNNVIGVLDIPTPPVTNSYESIATVNGTGSGSTITFSSIPSTYKHLQIRFITGQGAETDMFFNGDTGANYNYHYLLGTGASVSAGAVAPANWIGTSYTGASQPANTMVASIVDILDYTNTNKYKTVRVLAGGDTNGAGGLEMYSGAWRNTAAITSISFVIAGGGNFTSQSTFALYGIKG